MSLTDSIPRARASFPVRKINGSYDSMPKYWYASQPVATAFWSALSFMFPPGERFFMDSIIAVKDQIEDPDLLADIKAFLGQEAAHGQEHTRLNVKIAKDFNADPGVATRRLRAAIAFANAKLPKVDRVALTAGAEHLTGILAASLMSEPQFQDSFQHPAGLKLVMWHAVEESEHRAVAFDVYQAIDGAYVRRVRGLITATGVFVAHAAIGQVHVLRQDGQLTNVSSWLHFARTLVSPTGLLKGSYRHYFDYFRPSFHPHDHNTHDLEEHWKRRLDLKV